MPIPGSLPPQRDLVDGVREVPGGSLPLELANPSTGEPLGRAACTSADALERAIAAAARVHADGSWGGLDPGTRAAALERVADQLEARAEAIGAAEAMGSGVPISIASAFGGATAGSFREAVALMREAGDVRELGEPGRPVELWRFPWGPAAVLVPWNAAAAMAAKKAAFALAAGAPVLLKAPERSPWGCNLVADAIDAAGLPPGAFQLVHGGAEAGSALTGDPRVRAVSFTGSVATGRSIARAAAEDFKALQLELGGNNPVVVLPDADVAETAASLASGMVKLNGQWCEGPGKVLVPPALHDELVAALLEALAAYRMGPHDDPSTQLGPLSSAAHREGLDAQVAELVARGGTVHASHEAPATGAFWSPRVITGVAASDAVEELFGPVVTVHPVDSPDEAVAIANASPYGLAAYAFGRDTEAAMGIARRLRFGEVKVNGTSLLDLAPGSAQSFWRSSGIGGHGDRDVMAFFRGTQVVGVDRTGLPI